MYDESLALEILQRLHQAAETIMQRFEPIKSVEDFTCSPSGMEKLDSICMLLIAIGEGLKNLDKVTDGHLLAEYPQVDWKKAKGLRDIISHHYFDVDAEEIFYICKTHIGTMRETLRQIIAKLA
ncbi:MAG: antitoxin [Deltaproteobacteria bacterium RIFCSPLOWO2_02_FULL_53_8]|nr:MAG: antitoxin [Deltaproteobacteria bacterium RIFCSPLOWO2_02_FULL_53_8]